MTWWRRHKELLLVVIPGVLIGVAWIAQGVWGQTGWRNALMVAASLIAGVPIAVEGWKRLRHRQFSIPLLVTIAAGGALSIGEVWEAAAVTFLFKFGGYLEGLTLGRTRAALRELLDLRPLTARVKDKNGEWREVPAEKVQVGQVVMVRPGDKVPVDGKVIAGQAALDTSALTGEPLPKETAVGDSVLSGSINRGGYIEIAAERVSSDTTFNRLIKLVAQAQSEKPKVQYFLDRFAQWYTPAIILAAILLGLWTREVHLALTFLVIGCPGALVVAAPVAVVAGLGRAARSGILIKGGERLEMIGRLDTIAFDKTGTLTEGRPSVSRVIAFTGTEREVLALAATAELRSEHHLAAAILAKAKDEGVEVQEADDWAFHPGLGISAELAGSTVYVGNRRLLERFGVAVSEEQMAAAREREALGEALAFVAKDRELIGLITVHDRLRPETESLVAELRRAGIRHTVMLTGDHAAAANRVARQVGIGEVRAGLLPAEKVAALKEIQAAGRRVAMIGDGINDAPALATADVSIAMGASGTQVAMESADIVLVEDRIDKVPAAIHLSRRILGVIRQNVAIAVLTVLVLLFGVLNRSVGLSLGMLVHQASVLIVIANGMRLLRAKEVSVSWGSVDGKRSVRFREAGG